MIAHVTNLQVGEFVHTLGDAHIYLNHVDQVNEQLTRKPYKLPTLRFRRQVSSIFPFTYEDIEIVNYQAHPNIKGEVSV